MNLTNNPIITRQLLITSLDQVLPGGDLAINGDTDLKQHFRLVAEVNPSV